MDVPLQPVVTGYLIEDDSTMQKEKGRTTHELRNEVIEELNSLLVGRSSTERKGVLRSGSRNRGMESAKGSK